MKSLICGAAVAATILAAGLISVRVDAAAADPASVETVMKKLFSGKNSPNNTLKAAVKSGSPDWAKVKEASDVFAKFAPDLVQNEAPKGDKASWEKLSKALADDSKALGAAVDAKDLDKLKAATGKIGTSCKSCHDAHRPE